MGRVVNATPRPLYPRERDPAPIVLEIGWAAGSGSTAEENLASTGIRFPDRPARSESLDRLCYPGRLNGTTKRLYHEECQYVIFSILCYCLSLNENISSVFLQKSSVCVHFLILGYLNTPVQCEYYVASKNTAILMVNP